MAGVFGASVLCFAVIGGAALALAWMVQDQRGARSSTVLGASVTPRQSDLGLPEGVVALERAADAASFESMAGFAPLVPSYLPPHTRDDLSFSVTLPDDAGRRVGRVGYSAKDDGGEGGITGPLVVLWESPGPAAGAADGTLQRLTTGTGRALASTFTCGALAVDVQLYYGPPPAEGEPYVTPGMTADAQRFVDTLRTQC